eukprot:395815_1
MYQQGLVSNDEQVQNFYNNQEYMPNPPTDKRDVIAFKRWNAAAWVRPMYFLSLLLMALMLIVNFIGFIDSGSTGIIFFGVVLILVCCGACLIFHRIMYELIMVFLQIPKLVNAMERLADIVQKTNGRTTGTHDGSKPSAPIMTTSYQQGYQSSEQQTKKE